MADRDGRRADTRTRVVATAARLLREEGASAVTTRAVAEAAGVQAPAIYRLFGDKDGLLEAVAEHVLSAHVAEQGLEVAAEEGLDPVGALRTAWRAEIAFALANPALVRMLADADRPRLGPAADRGRQVLAARLHRVAQAGRLRVPEAQAVELVLAAGAGAMQALLGATPGDAGPALGDRMLDAVLAAVLADPDEGGAEDAVLRAAVTLRAAERLEPLVEAEHGLLNEWLDRVIDAADQPERR